MGDDRMTLGAACAVGWDDHQYHQNSHKNNAEEHVKMRRRFRGQAGMINGRTDLVVDEEKG